MTLVIFPVILNFILKFPKVDNKGWDAVISGVKLTILRDTFDTRYRRYLHYSRRSRRHVPIAFDLPHRLQTEFSHRIERALLHFSLPGWIGSNALFMPFAWILSSRYLFILSPPHRCTLFSISKTAGSTPNVSLDMSHVEQFGFRKQFWVLEISK